MVSSLPYSVEHTGQEHASQELGNERCKVIESVACRLIVSHRLDVSRERSMGARHEFLHTGWPVPQATGANLLETSDRRSAHEYNIGANV
mmetsp:Transcript_150594/g.262358  ORF Transcript_150594/g.262358 Transcript_150594/m.262358 type:complete len:90 (-) Transcript_150594:1-270(-)